MIYGDWRWFWPQTLRYFTFYPSAWDSSLNTGVGQSGISTLWINEYLHLTASLSRFGLPWELIGFLFWLLPPLIISFFSAFILFRKLFIDKKQWSSVAGILYVCNSYFLMIYTGGQIGVSLAYSLVPFYLLSVIRLIENRKKKTLIKETRNIVIAGLVLSFITFFDIRVTLLSVIVAGIYYIFQASKGNLFRLFLSFCIVPFLHAYWVLPMLVFRGRLIDPLIEQVRNNGSIDFFSFADFSHSFSLLHPNWPENMFGKVYFMQPEFIILPILAYSALLIHDKKNFRYIAFLSLLGLIGSFLSKGINPPFGQLYSYFVQKISLLSIFRDPTKFYMFTALSYSMLIPYVLGFISSKGKKTYMYVAITVICIVLMHRQGVAKLASGIVTPVRIPPDYVKLTSFLSNQHEFFRTLWIPQWQRFGYFSDLHPAIGRYEILTEASVGGQLRELHMLPQELLPRLSVKYIVIPDDSQHEIFMTDRRYDDHIRQQAIAALDQYPFVKEKIEFGNTTLYEFYDHKPFMWIEELADQKVIYKRLSPSKYIISSNLSKGTTLVISQSFDSLWSIYSGNRAINAMSTDDGLLSFHFSDTINQPVILYYKPQRYVDFGSVISLISIIVTGILFITSTYKMKKKKTTIR